jgi:hypothetical protein
MMFAPLQTKNAQPQEPNVRMVDHVYYIFTTSTSPIRIPLLSHAFASTISQAISANMIQKMF